MKRHGPVNCIIHFPITDDGKLYLAQRMAEVHADYVHRRINILNCPTAQKLQLLDAVIETVKQQSKKNVQQ